MFTAYSPHSLKLFAILTDSLTIDYRRQSTFGVISLASSQFAGRCSRRRNPVQANWCSVVCCGECCEYFGRCWLRLPGCRSGVFRCSPPTELPRCLSIFPSKRFHHSPRAQTQNFRCCSHSSELHVPARDAANSSSIAKTCLHLPSSPPPNGLANSAESHHITWSRVASSRQYYYNSCDTQQKPHCTHAHTVLHTRVTVSRKSQRCLVSRVPHATISRHSQ
jgi:hypothetical protein